MISLSASQSKELKDQQEDFAFYRLSLLYSSFVLSMNVDSENLLILQLVFTPLGVIGFFVVLLNLEGRQAELAGKLQKVTSIFILLLPRCHFFLLDCTLRNLVPNQELKLCFVDVVTISNP